MTYKAYTRTGDHLEGVHSFSQSKAQRIVFNYLDKIVWILIIFIVVFTLLMVGTLSLYGIISLLCLCTLPFLFGKIQDKFAYKVVLDFDSKSVQLYMNRSNEIIELDFEDVKDIRLNGYIIFVLKQEKFYYAETQNKSLLKCLNEIRTIEWGFLCNLFGPSKIDREEILG